MESKELSMPSNLHLPEFRVTVYVPGVPIGDMNGYYIRAANDIEAEQKVRRLTMKSADGSKDIPLFDSTQRLRAQYWKPPLYPLAK